MRLSSLLLNMLLQALTLYSIITPFDAMYLKILWKMELSIIFSKVLKTLLKFFLNIFQ